MPIAAIYARVSSDKQREASTIASQTAALIGFARSRGYQVPTEWVFEDEGYSGASLVRPGLERVRDLAAEGQIEAVLVYAPDRLSRKYAYQILLIEELARHGVDTVFMQAPQAATAEDQLLVQFQGMIAEYERAQILERSRRGKRHRARQGQVNVLSGAPYGYRYTATPREAEKPLANRRDSDSTVGMIRRGFLDAESRKDLTELARDGSAAHRLARRANALVLLDDGMSCEAIAKVLLLDDDTIRTWYRLYEEDGIEGLASFGYEGGACRLNEEQQDKLKAWISDTLPRTTREVGAWIEKECGIEYQGRSGLIALLHRVGMEHRKPKTVSRKLDPEKQAAFIKAYEELLNRLDVDEAVLFADAVHPTHAVRPVGCWAPKDTPIAVAQTSGRQRLNIHGAIDLETGHTRMLEVETVDAASTIRLMIALLTMYPRKRVIHLFLDNARYHHAKLVQAWLARPGCRIRLHFIPTYCPHLDPIERLWGLMHKHITHNTCHETFRDFSGAILTFLREEVPRNWRLYCDEVTDNFRIISPKDFRILA
jgi:DNA invertase Pin-like site-specific DNA recombinase/transposase